MDTASFKAGLSRFGSGVTVITTRDSGGEPSGFTANSFSALSLNPPLVLFCLDRTAACFDAFYGTDLFAVNILAFDQQDVSNRFSQRGGNKFGKVDTRDGAGGVPIIEGCLANLECRITQRVPGGDHFIFMGEVTEIHLGGGEPLFYYMGKYHSLGSS